MDGAYKGPRGRNHPFTARKVGGARASRRLWSHHNFPSFYSRVCSSIKYLNALLRFSSRGLNTWRRPLHPGPPSRCPLVTRDHDLSRRIRPEYGIFRAVIAFISAVSLRGFYLCRDWLKRKPGGGGETAFSYFVLADMRFFLPLVYSRGRLLARRICMVIFFNTTGSLVYIKEKRKSILIWNCLSCDLRYKFHFESSRCSWI